MARGSDDGFQAWLMARGHVLPDGAPTPAVLRQRATDYIDGLYGARLIGDQTVDPLLSALEGATYAAAFYEAGNLGALSVAVTAAGAVKREKIGPIETEYFGGSGDAASDATPVLSIVQGLLSPYLITEGASMLGIWSIGG